MPAGDNLLKWPEVSFVNLFSLCLMLGVSDKLKIVVHHDNDFWTLIRAKFLYCIQRIILEKYEIMKIECNQGYDKYLRQEPNENQNAPLFKCIIKSTNYWASNTLIIDLPIASGVFVAEVAHKKIRLPIF